MLYNSIFFNLYNNTHWLCYVYIQIYIFLFFYFSGYKCLQNLGNNSRISILKLEYINQRVPKWKKINLVLVTVAVIKMNDLTSIIKLLKKINF